MIQGLTPSGDPKPDGKQYYEPVVLTVSGYSQYNENQISFTEIDGFWGLPNGYMKVDKDDGRPPLGAVARFDLSSKPKTSPSAKPGSLYRDITGIYKIAEGEQPIAQQSAPPPPAGDPREQWSDAPPTGNAPDTENIISTPSGAYHMTPKDYQYIQGVEKSQARERKMMAWLGLSYRLAGNHDWKGEALVAAEADWEAGYTQLKNGETPFTIEETEWENPATEVDEQAQAHLADVANEQPANEDGFGEAESVPW